MKVPRYKGPRWNAADRVARKQAKADAAADNGKGGNAAKLATRIDRIEKILGIVPATTKEPVR